jgi:hypothetical protein
MDTGIVDGESMILLAFVYTTAFMAGYLLVDR